MDAKGPVSQFAIVAPRDFEFALGRLYEAHRELDSRTTKRVSVFRSRPEALGVARARERALRRSLNRRGAPGRANLRCASSIATGSSSFTIRRASTGFSVCCSSAWASLFVLGPLWLFARPRTASPGRCARSACCWAVPAPSRGSGCWRAPRSTLEVDRRRGRVRLRRWGLRGRQTWSWPIREIAGIRAVECKDERGARCSGSRSCCGKGAAVLASPPVDTRPRARRGVGEAAPEALGLPQPTDNEERETTGSGARLREGHAMLYMIIERFKNGDPVPVYRRFRDQGRSPAGRRSRTSRAG